MSTNSERIKWLGESAEHYFDGLCIGAKLTRSRPGQDEQGWDFFVEMPPNRLPAINLDAQPAPIKFLCQVKGTDDFSDRKLRNMKVSNFDHLARTPLPSFLLIVDYEGTDQPKATYLCHFNDKRVTQTLQRIRELEARGDTELHKHEMIFIAEESELVAFTKRDQLFSEITKHTGPDLLKYTARKAEWLRTLGYEPGRYKLSFKSQITVDGLVDAFLGVGKLEIENAVVTSSRFGIEIKEKEFTSGIISIEPTSAGDCRISVSSRKGRAQVAGQVYAPPIPELPPKHLKLKVNGSLLQAYLSPPTCHITFSFDPNTPYELNEFISNVDFMCLSAEPDAMISFQKDRQIFASTENLRQRIELDPMFPPLRSRLRLIRRFLDFSECRESVLLCARDAFEPEETLRWMNLATSKAPQRITSKFESDEPIKLIRRNGVLARPIVVSWNDRHFVAFCYWKARFTIEQGHLAASVRECQLWSSMFIDGGDTVTLEKETHDFKQFCEGIADGVLMHFSPQSAGP